ncbi:sterol desaturase family protein [Parvularcula sp. LCG005]|uniref:sterol desaturase family protein n=1 Tax=Parvularcula sp. LCG005 TaxID=3078805 RepID=UPI002942BC0A|nr:sterol desaturase family protein [Parvularcula sp. LCG005]WOI52718.1 sterol desaturase family protein [Parvularcula sp. LCG005]
MNIVHIGVADAILSVMESEMRKLVSVLPFGRLDRGTGEISGVMAAVCGGLTCLTVTAMVWPDYLTTPGLRHLWALIDVRSAITAGLIATYAFALWNIANRVRNRGAVIGVGMGALAFALGGPDAKPVSAGSPLLTIGLDWLILGVLTTGPLFIAVEKARPLRRRQPIFRAKWTTDAIYFVVNHLLVGVFAIVTLWIASHAFGWAKIDRVAAWVQAMPLAVQFIVMWLVIDFVFYWGHRAFHEHRLFWRFHSVHHSAEKMDWLASSRLHFLESLFTRSATVLPVYLLGFSDAAIGIYLVYIGIHATLLHVNADITFGPFEHIIVSPKNHHWHHAKEAEGVNKNYASQFAIYDRIFGTYYNPDHWPKAYGVMANDVPQSFKGQLLHPFTKRDHTGWAAAKPPRRS